MPDFGPHNAECATADGGTCYCDCHGAMHGIKATAGKSGSALTRHMGDVSVTKRSGGGYAVIDKKTNLPPGGGTQRERAIASRMGDVTVKGRDEPPAPRFKAPERELSPAVQRKAAKVRAGLPTTKDAWNAHIPDSHEATAQYYEAQARKTRARLAEREAQFEAKRAEWETNYRAEFEADPRYQGKGKKATAAREEWLATLHKSWGADSIAYLRADAERDEAGAAEWRAKGPNPVYKWDANSAHKIVPEEWNGHLKDVLSVGKATLAEHRTNLHADREYERLGEHADQLKAAEHDAWLAWMRADEAGKPAAKTKLDAVRADEKQAKLDVLQYDRDALLATLKAARPFGGGRIADEVTPLAVDQGDAGGHNMREQPARSDWADMLRTAEGFYPDAWLAHSRAYGPMTVASSPRAFHRDYGPGKGSLLAMPAEDVNVSYTAAHGIGNHGYATDVTVHEMGHRMERSVPGLTHLEMAFVRKRSTNRKGAVEDPKSLGYSDASEVAFHDKWKNAYTGKTYEVRGRNPGEESWEVFQVGMQDTFSRTKSFDESDELQQFVIGALLTLP